MREEKIASSRLAALEKAYRAKDAQGIILTDPHSLRYFTGFSAEEAVALITRKRRFLYTDSRYMTQAKQECVSFEICLISARHSAAAQLSAAAAKEKLSAVAFEDASVAYKTFERLRKAMPQTTLVPIGEAACRLRMVKSAEELQKLSAAEEIGSNAFRHIVQHLRAGISELSVAAELEAFMKKAGAEGISFPTIVASGLRSAMPHGTASAKCLEAGDFVTMDFGCVFSGYCSDMTRTVVLGKANAKQREIYATVRRAQEAALAALRPGMKGKEGDAAARRVIEAAGYGTYFGHATGHGVGLAIHEEPRLSAQEETRLSPGMVVTVEPGIYLPGFGGVRIEDMVAVTEDGIRNFTTAPKVLLEIPV